MEKNDVTALPSLRSLELHKKEARPLSALNGMKRKTSVCYNECESEKKNERDKMGTNGRELNENWRNSMQNGNKAENECVNLFEFDVSLHRGVFIQFLGWCIIFIFEHDHVTSTNCTGYYAIYTRARTHTHTNAHV